jgi:hypothetical protein
MYAVVQDLRAEGVTPAMASDARLESLIREATQAIDRMTGWYFEPRHLTYGLSGRGSATLELPVPLLYLERVAVNGNVVSLQDEDVLVFGRSTLPGDLIPQLTLDNGWIFPKGAHNVAVTGLWGVTEADGSELGGTPLEIRRACMLLVLRSLPLLSGQDSADARNRWRILEERTRDQSYRLESLKNKAPLSGDPEVDDILLRYRRPAGLGAA